MKLREWPSNPKFWIVIACILGVGVCYYVAQIRNKQNAAEKALIPKQETSQIETKTAVDERIAQAAIKVSSNTGVDYNSGPETQPVSQPLPSATPLPEVPELPPLILCDVASTPTPSPTPIPKAEYPDYWLPRQIYIPCVTMGWLDSSHMTTPVVLVVTEDVYQRIHGISHLIIPAHSRLMSFAAPGYVRDRVEVKGEWDLLFVNDGTEVKFHGILCDQEYNARTNHYGLEDKSAGIRGYFHQSDQWSFVRNLGGLLLTTGANALVQAPSTFLQQGGNGSSSVISNQVPAVAPILNDWIQKIVNPAQLNDTILVSVPHLKPCYVLTTSVVEVRRRSKGAEAQATPTPEEETSSDPSHIRQLQKVLNRELDQLNEPKDPKNETDPNASFK